jgi:hypothetical protein
MPRLRELAASPAGLTPLPMHVDLPSMLGWAALALGAIGAGVALLRRDRFSMLFLLWTLLLLPLVLVDWFDIWYLPHRTVAYMALGVAALAGLAVSHIAGLVRSDRPHAETTTAAVVGVALLFLTLPAAFAMEPWYRIYTEDDYEAWETLDEQDTEYVEAASWQGRMGYRAMTGREAVYNPPFFTDETTRDFELQQHPNLVVLVDQYAIDAGVPTDFLADWVVVGTWGNTTAYAAP